MGTTATDRLTIERRALILISILWERPVPGPGLLMGEIIESFEAKHGEKLAREQVHNLIKDINQWKYSYGSSEPIPIIEVRRSQREPTKVFYRLSGHIPGKVWDELLREIISITLLKHGELIGIQRLSAKGEKFSAFVNLHLAFEQKRPIVLSVESQEDLLVWPLVLEFNGSWRLKFKKVNNGKTDDLALIKIEKITLQT